ncbi:hypothetical protein CEXT_625261 [Caerostris extrusa]|uniref:Uncharacterized protein n=1 Tax=Caerostris extrusa TaxID=172846 RepID=A0AAV4NFJ5_CAEEX|nr:hypothetical protein CEXT_625261 [Caerostris extrusa]
MSTAIPAANLTTASTMTPHFVYTIAAIYGIVLILVLAIILLIVILNFRLKSSSKTITRPTYASINNDDRQNYQQVITDEPISSLDILSDTARSLINQDTDSEYDNVSLDLERIESGKADNEDVENIPPQYESPPSYLSVSVYN